MAVFGLEQLAVQDQAPCALGLKVEVPRKREQPHFVPSGHRKRSDPRGRGESQRAGRAGKSVRPRAGQVRRGLGSGKGWQGR